MLGRELEDNPMHCARAIVYSQKLNRNTKSITFSGYKLLHIQHSLFNVVVSTPSPSAFQL